MNLLSKIEKNTSERLQKVDNFVSLKQICLFLKKYQPDASWYDIRIVLSQELNSLSPELKLYSFSNGLMIDIAGINFQMALDGDRKPRTFEELGKYMEISAQSLLSNLDDTRVNGTELDNYGFKKSDLVERMKCDFTELVEHQEKPPAEIQALKDEIQSLKAEVAQLKKANLIPHKNAEFHATKREQILKAAIFLLYNDQIIWETERKRNGCAPEFPSATKLAARIEEQGVKLWDTGAPPLARDTIVALILESTKVAPKNIKK